MGQPIIAATLRTSGRTWRRRPPRQRSRRRRRAGHELAARSDGISRELDELNDRAAKAATAYGAAWRAFEQLERETGTAADAAFDAEQARAEMTVQAEAYILKRAQALTLRWADRALPRAKPGSATRSRERAFLHPHFGPVFGPAG